MYYRNKTRVDTTYRNSTKVEMSYRIRKGVRKLARSKHASLFYNKKDLYDLLAINEKLDFLKYPAGPVLYNVLRLSLTPCGKLKSFF
jgi:hypothetical protein